MKYLPVVFLPIAALAYGTIWWASDSGWLTFGVFLCFWSHNMERGWSRWNEKRRTRSQVAEEIKGWKSSGP